MCGHNHSYFLLWSHSGVIHASHAEHRGGVNWLMWGYLWTVSESFMINCVKCGRQCFHTLGNLHHTLPLHWSCPFDLSNGFGISSAACLPGALHCVNIIQRGRRREKKHMLHIQGGKTHELQCGMINACINFKQSLQPCKSLFEAARRCFELLKSAC